MEATRTLPSWSCTICWTIERPRPVPCGLRVKKASKMCSASSAAIVKDVVKRPFITVGFSAFVLLIPLAATSTHAMVRRLGGKAWQRLHYLVYLIATLGVVHYWWLVKKDVTQPMLFAAALAVLLGYRVVHQLRNLSPRSGAPACGRR